MAELFANNAKTTLNGAITNVATTLVVTSATSFPSSGNFRIKIDSEIMLVTAVSGTTFTVTRAQEGTSAAAHSDQAPVAHILTAAGLGQGIYDRANIVDTFANRPAAGIKGRHFFCTDGPIQFVDDGSAWRPIIGGTLGTSPPAAATWTQINQAGASTTLSDYKGGLQLSATNGTTGVDLRLAKRTAGSTWTFTVHVLPCMPRYVNLVGIGARNSSNGSVILGSYVFDTSNVNQIHKLTASNTSTSPTFSQSSATTVANGQTVYAINGFWFRLVNDGTNINFYLSTDGYNFSYLYDETLATFIGTADEAFIHIFYSSATSKPFSAVFDSITLV